MTRRQIISQAARQALARARRRGPSRTTQFMDGPFAYCKWRHMDRAGSLPFVVTLIDSKGRSVVWAGRYVGQRWIPLTAANEDRIEFVQQQFREERTA